MAKEDPRDFLLNTDYEMDKIIYFKDGELSNMTPLDITHNLKFTPLLFGVCAFNSDFSDSRPIPYIEVFGGGVGYICSAFSFPDRVHIEYSNLNPNPPAKIYYRIFGFEPSNSRARTPTTSKYAKQFILNTDYNYCKLFKKGIVEAGPNETVTIDHGLGYIPQVLVWEESENGMTIIPYRIRLPRPNYQSSAQYIQVTNTSVVIQNMTSKSKYHYRIYYDEA